MAQDPGNTLSSDKLASLTGLTDRRHRQLAKEGCFPNPERGQYQLVATLRGLFKYFQEQLHKKNDNAKKAEQRLKEAKADMAEEELAEFRNQYVLKKEIGPALRNISLHQRAILQRKLENEISPKVAGCKPAEVLAMHKAAVDEICAIFLEGTRQWIDVELAPEPAAPGTVLPLAKASKAVKRPHKTKHRQYSHEKPSPHRKNQKKHDEQ